ncbi:MAG: oligopeptide/dipeptide ABC transporter ATPase, peptide/nickel transport system ATP-binding protein [Candidatus Rokubacteria bacterium CSP1-6]|nr:MAG: oligopeptide/dipeptide ABC transporter ATPase, peptide/nickel transport system ATP-binding protein [Candidatus Rokubacteria bacterium CSP1-6]
MTALLEVQNLKTHYRLGGWLSRRRVLRAVDGVNLTLAARQTLAVVGESGSGKTTLGRTILRLVEPTDGRIILDGQDISRLSQARLRPLRRRMQIVFQHPYASLNPRKRVGQIVAQPLRVHRVPGNHRRQVGELLERVGLSASAAKHYPHEFSGGQRQRIAIARALALRPDLIVLDEITSGLDVTVKLRVLALLRELQAEFHLAYLFISHDLSVVRTVSDRVAVMYLGRIVEEAPTEALFERPLHPYTQVLKASIPEPAARGNWNPPVLVGEAPSPVNVPPGCRFHPRCPLAQAVCREVEPELRELAPAHRVACHLAEAPPHFYPHPPHPHPPHPPLSPSGGEDKGEGEDR